MKLFVYGTLKKGFRNHHFLKDATYLGVDILDGYILADLSAFPMAVPAPDGFVIGELYYITPSILERLDALEGEGVLYDRVVVNGEIEQNLITYIGTSQSTQRCEETVKEYTNFWTKGFKK